MTLTCISPIDGSVYATRAVLTEFEAAKAVAEAQAAQLDWAARSLAERIELVLAGIANVGAMNDEIVPELAWQMGRPVRYGGEFGGFEERGTYMAGVAPETLAPLVVGGRAPFYPKNQQSGERPVGEKCSNPWLPEP